MKIAGSIAVQIQNARNGTQHDDGFGKADDSESDAYCIECLHLYWMSLNMPRDHVQACDTKLRNFVRDALSNYWPLVEAIAEQIAALKPSGPPLTAVRIGEIVNDLNPTFYSRVKTHLLTDETRLECG
jgi:hypothetical protein